MDNIKEIIADIQDKLVPILDVYEQAIYHYVFRHTYLVGKKTCFFKTRSAEIGYGAGDNSKNPSVTTRSLKLRRLEEKGCIEIIERTREGISVKILLPSEISSIQNKEVTEKEIDIEKLNFYKDKRLLNSLFIRENNRCFYTNRKVTTENYALDHVIPKASGGDDTYRNIVVSSYDANSMKNNRSAEELAKTLYKEAIISLSEFQQLNKKILDLKNGNLKPDINIVRDAIKS